MKKENLDIELSTVPNDKYKKFFAKFEEIKTLPVENWKLNHILGYFAQKYQEHYHCTYQWKFNHSSPSKCFEVWQINVLASKLSSRPTILKEYIDWMFANHVIKAKRKLTSISFLTHDDVIKPYKLALLNNLQPTINADKIDRNKLLSDQYQSLFQACQNISIKTYGDLSFAFQLDPMPEDVKQAFIQLGKAGFDLEMLWKVV